MPETSLVEPPIAGVRNRELKMTEATVVKEGLKHALDAERSIEPGGNLRASWEALLKDARKCTRCELYKHATQTVFGEGPLDASIMFVGEQPGDQEDLAGRPFVGPAGALFDAALEKAGIDRSTVYVTNAVKHFKWEPRGKRRIHKKPNAMEIAACRPWLDAEIEAVRPEVIVCLGATAAQALLGKQFRVTKSRGEIIEAEGKTMLATVHPSSILRAPDDEARRLEREKFVQDLRTITQHLQRHKKAA
jgi:uracil-DNA glycosylase family protein